MGYMKNDLLNKVYDNLATISNHCDGDPETLLCKKLEEAYGLLQKASDTFAEFEATWDAYVEENSEGLDSTDVSNDVYEKCCGYSEQFEEMNEELRNIFN